MTHTDGAPSWPDDPDGAGRPARPFTLASLGVSVAVCVAWYVVVVAGYFAYANAQSATAAAPGCAGTDCPSQRAAWLTLGYFGLLPTSLVSLLASLVVLVFAARRLRIPFVLGTVSALAGMVLGVVCFVTIATYDVPTGQATAPAPPVPG